MKGGESVADFEIVFRENQAFIYRYLLKLCQNKELAEELTQETFFRAYMNLSSVRNEGKIAGWLCQIAKNSYYAWYNSQKKVSSFEEDYDPPDPYNIEEVFLEKEVTDKALQCLHRLEEPYKEVFMLSVFGQIPLKEISRLFGKSESWAKVTFYRAKQKLMEEMR